MLALVSCLGYANTLGGDFVYDDVKQIQQNRFVTDPGSFWEGLASDVWAFKGDERETWSNYWRPAFVVWMVINERLFGTNDATGWHVSNILLHLICVLLLYLLSRHMNLSAPLAGVVSLLWAVHPAHVESVAWIAGSPNMLSTAPLLAILVLLIRGGCHPSVLRWVVMVLLYVVSITSKEIGVLFPAITAVTLWVTLREELPDSTERLRRAAWLSLPFALIGLGFLVARHLVLGQLEVETAWSQSFFGWLPTYPLLFAFYLRQCFFPYWIGPSYPLRAAESFDMAVLGASALTVAFLVAAVVLVRRRPIAAVGVLLFLLPLLPAVNLNAFIQEQIVHDRYLYLPLAGMLIALAVAVEQVLRTSFATPEARQRGLLVAAVVLCLPLLARTVSYNRAWLSEEALWQWGIRSDPTSAFNRAQYGEVLYRLGRVEEAKRELDQALAIRNVTHAFLTRARIAIDQRDFGVADDLISRVRSDYPEMPSAWELAAVSLDRQGRFAEAAALLREARTVIPTSYASLTANLAVMLQRQGQMEECERELLSAVEAARRERDSGAKKVFYFLGLVVQQRGDEASARVHFEEYLQQTGALRDEETLRLREQVRQRLSLAFVD